MPKINLVHSFIAFLLLAIAPSSAAAQSPSNPAGQWVLTLGKRTFLVLSISPTSGQKQPFSGSLSRPAHFQTSDSRSFSHIHGGVETKPIVSSSWKGSALSITLQNPENSSDRDSLLLTFKDATHAELQWVGIPVPPFELLRTDAPHSVATDWDQCKTYSPDDVQSSNPEMKHIFDEDQQDRKAGVKIDWAVVGKSDAERRRAVMKLLNEGLLHTGEDFTWAAFVFQHGSTPDDYLLAHTLAMIALKKGYGDALWIATATLDRYLQSIHQPQIYGTQFLTKDNQPTTQEPYNRKLISDALRRQLDVPIQSAQEKQRQQYDVERGISK